MTTKVKVCKWNNTHTQIETLDIQGDSFHYISTFIFDDVGPLHFIVSSSPNWAFISFCFILEITCRISTMDGLPWIEIGSQFLRAWGHRLAIEINGSSRTNPCLDCQLLQVNGEILNVISFYTQKKHYLTINGNQLSCFMT